MAEVIKIKSEAHLKAIEKRLKKLGIPNYWSSSLLRYRPKYVAIYNSRKGYVLDPPHLSGTVITLDDLYEPPKAKEIAKETDCSFTCSKCNKPLLVVNGQKRCGCGERIVLAKIDSCITIHNNTKETITIQIG